METNNYKEKVYAHICTLVEKNSTNVDAENKY